MNCFWQGCVCPCDKSSTPPPVFFPPRKAFTIIMQRKPIRISSCKAPASQHDCSKKGTSHGFLSAIPRVICFCPCHTGHVLLSPMQGPCAELNRGITTKETFCSHRLEVVLIFQTFVQVCSWQGRGQGWGGQEG